MLSYKMLFYSDIDRQDFMREGMSVRVVLEKPRKRGSKRKLASRPAMDVAADIWFGIQREWQTEGCVVIWQAGSTVVALGPDFTEFLVWLDIDAHPAYLVPITPDTIKYFHQEIEPALYHHVQAARTIKDERVSWALDVAAKVSEGTSGLIIDSPSSPPDKYPQATARLSQLYGDVVKVLKEFVTHYDAQPEDK